MPRSFGRSHLTLTQYLTLKQHTIGRCLGDAFWVDAFWVDAFWVDAFWVEAFTSTQRNAVFVTAFLEFA